MRKTAKNKSGSSKPSLLIDWAIHDPAWNDLGFDARRLIERAVRHAVAAAAIPKPIKGRKLEVGIVLTDDGEMQTLNRFYRKKNKPTNVLSFANLDSENLKQELKAHPQTFNLGDIALSYETLAREAITEHKEFSAHLAHLAVHGTLHLLQYDHSNRRDAERMEALEIKILEKMGYENPYAQRTFMA